MAPAAREASVVLGDDALVRGLNRTYRGKDTPTNVLSFPFQLPPGAGLGGRRLPGRRRAGGRNGRAGGGERGIPPVHHLQHLVVHGLLHLLGYDHQTDAEAEPWSAWRPRSWRPWRLPILTRLTGFE